MLSMLHFPGIKMNHFLHSNYFIVSLFLYMTAHLQVKTFLAAGAHNTYGRLVSKRTAEPWQRYSGCFSETHAYVLCLCAHS